MRRQVLLSILAPAVLIGAACSGAPAVVPTSASSTVAPAAATSAPPAATATTAPPTATVVPPTPTVAPPTPTVAPPTPTSVPTAAPTEAAAPAAGDADNDSSNGSAIAGTPAPRATRTASGGGQTAAAAGLDVPAIEAALAEVKTFRAELSSGEGDEELHGSMEVVLPDAFHVILEGVPGQANFDMISIGEDTYLNTGEGWEKMPAGEGSVGFGATTFEEFTNQLADPNTSVTKKGTATVRGEQCQEWDLDMSGEQQTMCVGDDNLMRRMQTNGMSVEIFDYNADIEIVPPIG